jgi:hypothetical protein
VRLLNDQSIIRSCPRLHAGYCFSVACLFTPADAGSRPSKNRTGAGFEHFREPERPLLNRSAPIQHSEIALPKPGVRGSSPLRDANFHTTFDVPTCMGMNCRATGRRKRRVPREGRGRREESRLHRGYRAGASSTRLRENGSIWCLARDCLLTSGSKVRTRMRPPSKYQGRLTK